ncbi:MAG: hypothetical protein AB9891_09210 [Anaerolineaceae bacterium]
MKEIPGDILLVSFFLTGIGFFCFFFFQIRFRDYPKQTEEEILLIAPSLKPFKKIYDAFFPGILIIFFLTFWGVIYSGAKSNLILCQPLVFPLFAIFNGIFALRTNVFPVWSKYNHNQFVYDEDKSMRGAAIAQIVIAIVCAAIIFAVSFSVIL